MDLGSNFNDEIKLATFRIAAEGPIDLGSDSGDETKISIEIVPNMERTPNATWIQELEEIN